MSRRNALSVGLLLLAACSGSGEEHDIGGQARSAQSGLRVGVMFMEEESELSAIPASTAGIRTGTLLMDAGIAMHIPSPSPRGDTKEPLEDIELIGRLIELLSTDVWILLNASSHRTNTLENYLTSLHSHLQTGQIRFRALQDREEDLRDDRSRLERGIRDLQSDLDNAIRAGNSLSTRTMTEQLIERQTTLVKTTTELTVASSFIDVYEEVLTPLSERFDAITENRDALIKGVRVVDIPGVEDLGLIEVKDGVRRIRRSKTGFGGALF